ncbi:MAG: preprotein translocase subunit SecG [Bdellovibrionales bacterium]|nr:preprotein translocase subunit SecG [Bdellovibrionales bacterium]
MLTFLSVIHVIMAVFLIIFVLIQDSKGDGIGGAFGGGGGGNANSVLGATGAVSLLVKMTRWTVVIFAVTSIWLTKLTTVDTGSVLDKAGTTPTEKSMPEQVQPAPEGLAGAAGVAAVATTGVSTTTTVAPESPATAPSKGKK